MANQKRKANQNRKKTTKARGVYGLAAQTRQNRLNKALGDTGSGRVKRKPFAGKTKQK